MIKAIYSAEFDLGKLKIIKLDVVKETSKTIITTQYCLALGCRNVHCKKEHPIYLTPEVALEALLNTTLKKLKRAETDVEISKHRIDVIRGELKNKVIQNGKA